MVSRVSSRRRLLRDFQRTAVLFAGAALAAGCSAYLVGWPLARHAPVAPPPQSTGDRENDDLIYTGAILIPARGSLCWEATFDNRTGAMAEKGFVDCSEAIRNRVASNPSQGIEFTRLRAIGKAFNHQDQ